VHQTGGDGQTLRIGDRRRSGVPGRESLRRLRLRERLSGREILPRLQDRPDLRRHIEYAETDNRQEAAGLVIGKKRLQRGRDRETDRGGDSIKSPPLFVSLSLRLAFKQW